LILLENRRTLFATSNPAGLGILEPVAWVAGEYAEFLTFPDQTLSSLIHASNLTLSPRVLSSYIQAIPKLFVSLTSKYQYDWNPRRESEVTLLLARITDFLEKLSSHPDLDVQERAIEFLELLRVAAEAVSSANSEDSEMPLLLSSALPSLFTGLDLGPVAAGAQKKVPIPENLDLDTPLNRRLAQILKESEEDWIGSPDQDESHRFYYVADQRPNGKIQIQKEAAVPDARQPASYQNIENGAPESLEVLAKRRAERRERNRDDPFYIGHEDGSSGSSTPFRQVLRTANGEELDLDSIPIIDLGLDNDQRGVSGAADSGLTKPKTRSKPRKKVEILAEETIDVDDSGASTANNKNKATKGKKSLLEVDSSGLTALSLEEGAGALTIDDLARREAEEAEMAKAMREIERLRMEMQRASERVHAAEGEPPEGIVVKRKKKKKPSTTETEEKSTKRKSKSKDNVPSSTSALPADDTGDASTVVKKKKKKKVPKKEEPVTEAT
jgi:AP-3 complex subunit delta-1